MASNRDNQGSHTTGQSGSQVRSGRGFAAMDQEKQREIARKGGAASARSQTRDEQGQFGGSRTQSGTNPGSRSTGMSQGSGMSQGGGMRQGGQGGGMRQDSGARGGSSHSGSGTGGSRSGQGSSNR